MRKGPKRDQNISFRVPMMSKSNFFWGQSQVLELRTDFCESWASSSNVSSNVGVDIDNQTTTTTPATLDSRSELIRRLCLVSGKPGRFQQVPKMNLDNWNAFV